MNRWSFTVPHWTDVVVVLILIVGMGAITWAY